MARPLIGICAALEQARYGAWDQATDLLPREFTAAIERADAVAVMVPVQSALVDNPDEILDRIDGLVLAGGADIDPATYGAPAHAQTLGTSPQRDAMEIALARRAIARQLPVLGICRGMQLLNVAFGGSLLQHIPDQLKSEAHRSVPGQFGDHQVRLMAGSLAARAAASERHAVKSHHHQAIDDLGEGLIVSGWSDLDDLPEAVEAPGHRYVLGVQWHPEVDPDSPVVASLVAESRSRIA